MKRNSLIALACMVIVFGCLLWFSRLIFFIRPVATLASAPPAAAFLVGLLYCKHFEIPSRILLLVYSFLLLCGSWLYAFYANTGLIGDLRAAGNIAGILCFFPFYICFQRIGPEKTLKYIYWMAVGYILIYVTISLMLAISNLFADASETVILRDAIRGKRVYAASAAIAFALFWQIAEIRRGQKIPVNLVLLSLTAGAVYLQQSRVSIALFAINGLLIFLGSPKLRVYAVKLSVCLFLLYTLLAVLFEPIIVDAIKGLNDPTLSLRAITFDIAYLNFFDSPLLGLGLPTDATYYQRIFGPLYFPEDLGVLGLLGSYGIAGFLWILGLITLLSKAARTIDRYRRPAYIAVTHITTYSIMTVFFSQNIFQGDGGVFSGLVLAVGAYLASTARTTVRNSKGLGSPVPAGSIAPLGLGLADSAKPHFKS